MAIQSTSGIEPTNTSGKDIDTESKGESRFDDERLLSMEPFETLDNPVVRQQYRWLERVSRDDGQYLVMEIHFEPDAKNYPEHLHPRANETYKVLSGELIVTTAGEEHILGAGEEMTLPAGILHTHGNRPGTEARVLYEVGPTTGEESFFRTLIALAQAGKTDAQGTPNMLQIAVIFNAYPDMVYMASPSVGVQKTLFRVLAPFGRLLGYQANYRSAQVSNR